MTGALALALLLALDGEAAPVGDAPPPFDAPAPAPDAPPVDAPAPESEPGPAPAPPGADVPPLPDAPVVKGTMGGVLGAASGCAVGTGIPTLVGGAGGGLLWWLYSGAAAGTIVGWTPACAALGTSCGILGAAAGLPLLGAAGAAVGAMNGAQSDGRDPMPALYGALPGIGLAGISTALSCGAMVVGCGGLAAAQPAAILILAAVLTGAAGPPCAACGAGVADLVWGNATVVKREEPVARSAAMRVDGARVAMRF